MFCQFARLGLHTDFFNSIRTMPPFRTRQVSLYGRYDAPQFRPSRFQKSAFALNVRIVLDFRGRFPGRFFAAQDVRCKN